MVGYVFNVTRYKKFFDFVSNYVSQYIAEESDQVKYGGLNRFHCGCFIRSTHGLPCACELASFRLGSIPLQSMHFIWIRF